MSWENWPTELIPLDHVMIGDSIHAWGQVMTVCKKDIKFDVFMGTTIFGLNFRESGKKVKRLILRK